MVEKEDLKNRLPRTPPDALSEEPGVFVERSNYGAGSPYVRGLTGQQVLLLIDGIRLNNTTTRTGPNGMLNLIDPYTVDSIEVVRGPGSVLYGSDAVGGVVQVRTRRPSPIAGSDIDLNAGLRGSFTSYDQSGQGSLSAGGRWGRYALDTAFSLRRFGDLTGGSLAPYQPLTGYSEGGLYLGGGADLGRGTVVMVYQGVRQYNVVQTDRSQPGDLRVQTENSRDLGYLRYEGSFAARGLVEPLSVQATLSYQRQRELLDRFQTGIDLLDRGDNYDDVLGFNALVIADLGRPGKLTVGIDGYFDFVNSTASQGTLSGGPGAALVPSPQLARYPGGSTAQSVALYIQEETDLERLFGKSHPDRPGRWKALLGLRGGGTFVSIGRDDRLAKLFPTIGARGVREALRQQEPIYAGTLHLRYEPVFGLALSGGLMTGFRAPNLADYARLGQEGLGYIVPGPGELRPEFAYSGEIGVRAGFSKFEGGVFYAYTLIDDVIAATPTTVAGQGCARPGPDGSCITRFYDRENARQARLHAVEANARLHLFSGLSMYAGISYVNGVLDRPAAAGQLPTSEPFYKVPPLNGVAAVQLRRPRDLFSFAEVQLRWAAPQTLLGQADFDDPRTCLPIPAFKIACPGTPGFAVVNLRGAARLTRGVQITATLENVANTTYRFHGSGIDGPGLGAMVALEANYF